MVQELKESFAGIFEDELIKEIQDSGSLKSIVSGEKLIEIGDYIKYMPLLVSGVIKILREDEEGEELLLYYLEKGDTCSMTMACCLGDAKSEIRAVAETDTLLVMIPIQKMELWTAKYKTWRNFVFDSYHNRLNELLHTVDTIAFKKMDERLIDYLKKRVSVTGSNLIQSTHQEIAYDLHSSRVVISRLLKKLEQLEKLKMHRNAIEILNL